MSKRTKTHYVKFEYLQPGTLFTIKIKGKAPSLFVKLCENHSQVNSVACACGDITSALAVSRTGGYPVHFCNESTVQINDKALSYNISNYIRT